MSKERFYSIPGTEQEGNHGFTMVVSGLDIPNVNFQEVRDSLPSDLHPLYNNLLKEKKVGFNVPNNSNILNLSVDLRESLGQESLDRYDNLGLEFQARHQYVQDKIRRMGVMENNGYLLRPGHTETNLEHLYRGNLAIMDDFNEFPVLHEVMDFADIQSGYLNHDNDEEIVSDMAPASYRTYEEQQLKEWGPVLLEEYVYSQIPNEEARNDLIERERRFDQKRPDDLEYQYIKFADQRDGVEGALDVAFDIQAHREAGNHEVADAIENHLYLTVVAVVNPAINLLAHIDSHDARMAVREITLRTLDKIENRGGENVAKTYRQFFEREAS